MCTMSPFIVGFIIFQAIILNVRGECCHATSVDFRVRPGSSCVDIGNARYAFFSSDCVVDVCGDGMAPQEHGGSYCSWGGCNIFGCDCARECIPGNPYENFRSRYPDQVYWSNAELLWNHTRLVVSHGKFPWLIFHLVSDLFTLPCSQWWHDLQISTFIFRLTVTDLAILMDFGRRYDGDPASIFPRWRAYHWLIDSPYQLMCIDVLLFYAICTT